MLTSLLDPLAYPAGEVVDLYHERWELELGFDEVKTEMLDREEAIRSRSAAGVRQELWGLLLAYNLVRLEMERAADEAGVEPTRLSFGEAGGERAGQWPPRGLVGHGALRAVVRGAAAAGLPGGALADRVRAR